MTLVSVTNFNSSLSIQKVGNLKPKTLDMSQLLPFPVLIILFAAACLVFTTLSTDADMWKERFKDRSATEETFVENTLRKDSILVVRFIKAQILSSYVIFFFFELLLVLSIPTIIILNSRPRDHSLAPLLLLLLLVDIESAAAAELLSCCAPSDAASNFACSPLPAEVEQCSQQESSSTWLAAHYCITDE